eukprot:scaffold55035_cov23-Cyclotella_meneghiniana.AAC.1
MLERYAAGVTFLRPNFRKTTGNRRCIFFATESQSGGYGHLGFGHKEGNRGRTVPLLFWLVPPVLPCLILFRRVIMYVDNYALFVPPLFCLALPCLIVWPVLPVPPPASS